LISVWFHQGHTVSCFLLQQVRVRKETTIREGTIRVSRRKWFGALEAHLTLHHIALLLYNIFSDQWGLAATFDLAAFLVSMIAPFWSFENLSEHARKGKAETCSRGHFCPGFAFDLITLYSLLAIFNDSSETIRTKAMKDQLCAIFLVSMVAFLVSWGPFLESPGNFLGP